MGKSRAIMTDTERERLAGIEDVKEIRVYQAKSRVRRRIHEELTFDVELLAEHQPELFEELRDVVCDADPLPAQEEKNRQEEPDSEDATPGVDTRETTIDTPRADVAADLDEVLSGWRPGRSPGEKREQQRGAGRAALEYLAERDTATAAEFREDVEPDHPVEGQSPSTWWKKSARPALTRARDRGLVTFKDGSKEWRWKGSE